MNTLFKDAGIIEKFSEDVQGVFTLTDMKSIFPLTDPVTFYRKIKSLKNAGVLSRAVKGIYITENFDLKTLSQKIHPESYLSFETVLAKALIIGTIPSRQIKAVKTGKKREYSIGENRIIHVGISKQLYFGFEKINGIKIAVKEKAFLDTLYFYLKGHIFYFDIYSDLDTSKLDMRIIEKYLGQYSNPKFKKFVRGFFT
ncbi:MAG: hypothetical protein JW904_07235 [Spirochaetales bacterium]|nr:hypothetical protein [Spirochaetales bacterium]